MMIMEARERQIQELAEASLRVGHHGTAEALEARIRRPAGSIAGSGWRKFTSVNVHRYEDREAAYPFIVYQGGAPVLRNGNAVLTYDIADPDCVSTAIRATGMGLALRRKLASIEARLHHAGLHEPGDEVRAGLA